MPRDIAEKTKESTIISELKRDNLGIRYYAIQ